MRLPIKVLASILIIQLTFQVISHGDVIPAEKSVSPIALEKDALWARFKPNGDAEYWEIFAEIGLTPQQIESFILERRRLLRLAIADSSGREEFIERREGYYKQVSKLAKDSNTEDILRKHPLSQKNIDSVDPSLWGMDRDSDYENLYKKIGISSVYILALQEDRKRLKNLVYPFEAIIQGRANYLKKLNESVTPEKFEQYRLWELNKPARIGYQEFLGRTNDIERKKIAPYTQLIIDLFRETNIFPSRSFDGPFDRIHFGSTKGKEAVLELKQQERDAFENAVLAFNAAAVQQGLPPWIVDQLNDFYSEKRDKLRQEVMWIHGW